MSLRKRHDELGRRSNIEWTSGTMRKVVRLGRKRDAARRKAERRGEEWVKDYYQKPN